LDNPLPNVVYRVNDDFMVRTDEFVRPVEGYHPGLGVVDESKRLRSEKKQYNFNLRTRSAGPIPGRALGAGHLFRDMFGSPAEFLFYTPQRRAVNEWGDFYLMEEQIVEILKRTASDIPPGRVEYSILNVYDKNPSVARKAVGEELVPLGYEVLFREIGRGWRSSGTIFNI
jgi:hypothetical protein